jgi:hypothetical protein
MSLSIEEETSGQQHLSRQPSDQVGGFCLPDCPYQTGGEE